MSRPTLREPRPCLARFFTTTRFLGDLLATHPSLVDEGQPAWQSRMGSLAR
jgi:hypothetical protein